MNILFPNHIQKMQPYIPGKPIDETQREYGLKKVVKLASNENPLGPSPKAVQAIKKNLTELNLYPDSTAYYLKKALSSKLNVSVDELAIGNGSNELIDLLIAMVCVPGDQILTSMGAFVAYKVCAQARGVQTVETSLTNSLGFDCEKLLFEIKTKPNIKIVFLPNPNNPTGTFLESSDLESFISKALKLKPDLMIALDYAYWEYVTNKKISNPITLYKKYPQLVILQTFSKVYGLAAMRIGYAIGSRELIQTLNKIKEPFNVNSLALVAAEAALTDLAFVKKSKSLNEKSKKFWEKNLKKLSIPYWESQGNFILIDTLQGLGLSGGEVFQLCLRQGVILRPVTNYGLPNALRVTFGTDVENRMAIHAIEKIAKGRIRHGHS